jgi:L-serine dehydratase
MAVSVFELFKIGIGPSSSHTVGPMRAARSFLVRLREGGRLAEVTQIRAELFGSLALTGRGHATDKAVLLGLAGETPDGVNVESIDARLAEIRGARRLALLGGHEVEFDEARDLLFQRRQSLPFHANGMRFSALAADGAVLDQREYYSIGGGFVVDEEQARADLVVAGPTPLVHPFKSGEELLGLCSRLGLSIAEIVLRNESAWRSEAETFARLDEIWAVMQACVHRGLREEGVLPGGLGVRRRASALYRELSSRPEAALRDPLTILDWVNLYALAVNEENAAGGRVVTAPTNGAAGIVPAVLHYFDRFCAGRPRGTHDFLLTAAAIGALYKLNASISGAEVGCQGEVGVACSMAAAGLTAALGGTPAQVEYAAEIGMEHNLGLTCDPIGGLVQIPCIERNAMGAVKAINAARMALRSDGTHHVSLDKVIRTMRITGRDMRSKYKETAKGGLAVNVIEC